MITRFLSIQAGFFILQYFLTITVVAANEISVPGSCFEIGERIPVTFSKEDPNDISRTWIGIFSADQNINLEDLPSGEAWVWLCGSQTCSPSRNPVNGMVRFRRSSQGWLQSWPMQAGSYQAILVVGDDGEVWRAIATSNTFRIGCGGSPIGRPVSLPTVSPTNPPVIPEVATRSKCYNPGENIDVVYSGMTIPFTFLATFDVNDLKNSDRPSDGDIISWKWTCGSTSFCSTWSQSGNVNFRSMSEGNYRVLALAFDSTGFELVSSSEAFTVADCSTLPDPTAHPTLAPTSRPTNQPTEKPTPRPTPSVVTANEMRPVIARARRDIESKINENELLIGKFLRLVFHDCVGGCDGCVDMANPDNAGLVMPIDALESVVNTYQRQGLSRTDIWMLSALVASEVSETSGGTDFPMQWIGRKTCEEINNDDCGLNADGRRSPCRPFGGPHRELCHGDTAGTGTIQDFMSREFGFDAQQTTAIMGAHTVGAMRDVNLGFEGRSGWDLTNDVLDHGYFVELVGARGDPVDDAPNWRQVRHRNGDLRGIPDRWQYEVTVDGVELTMLNSDIALVRDLVEGENLQPDGRVTCDFKGRNQCSSDTPFMPFVIQYSDSRREFLADYREALTLLVETGYERGSSCGRNDVCVLRSNR